MGKRIRGVPTFKEMGCYFVFIIRDNLFHEDDHDNKIKEVAEEININLRSVSRGEAFSLLIQVVVVSDSITDENN